MMKKIIIYIILCSLAMPQQAQALRPMASAKKAELIDDLNLRNNKPSLARLLQYLRRQLSSKDPDRRKSAAKAIGNIKPKTIPPELIALLKDPETFVRKSAIGQIGNTKPKIMTPELVALLKHPDPEVRIAAIEAIGNIKSKTIPPELVALLKHPNPEVRITAARVVGYIKPKTVPSELLTLLKDPHPFVREAAARAIGNIKPKAIPAELIALLEDPNPSVRESVARAIGYIKYSKNTMFTRSIMVPARLDVSKDTYGTRGFIEDELRYAINNGVVIPIGRIVIGKRTIHRGFEALSPDIQERHRHLYERLKKEKVSLKNIFLVPAADPLKPAVNSVHDRSLYSEPQYEIHSSKYSYAYAIKGTGLSSPNLSGVFLYTFAQDNKQFMGGYDEDELFSTIGDTMQMRNAYIKHRSKDPNIKLAEFFQADIDTFTQPVAGFIPIYLPRAKGTTTELIDAERLLDEIGIHKDSISKRRFYLYRCAIATRFADLKDENKAERRRLLEPFFNRLGYKTVSRQARYELLFQAAARYALAIHIGHDILGRSFYKKEYGGVFTHGHNTNPFTTFDYDTIEKTTKSRLATNMYEDIKGAIELITNLGALLNLSQDSIKAAIMLFHEILLAEEYNPYSVIDMLIEYTEDANLRAYLNNYGRNVSEGVRGTVPVLSTQVSPKLIAAIEGAA